MIQNKTVKEDLLNAAGLGRQVLWQGKPPEIQYLIVRILAQHCLCTQLINPHLCKHCTTNDIITWGDILLSPPLTDRSLSLRTWNESNVHRWNYFCLYIQIFWFLSFWILLLQAWNWIKFLVDRSEWASDSQCFKCNADVNVFSGFKSICYCLSFFLLILAALPAASSKIY